MLPNSPKIAAFTCFALTVLLSSQSSSQLRYRIEEVVIQGNSSFSSSDLQEYAFIATPSWFQENIMDAEPSFYTEGLEAQVYTQVKNYYQKEGFLQVHVSKPIVKLDDENRAATLEIAIEENKPPFLDGRWGKATLEVCLAMLQSSKERREITLSHQVPSVDLKEKEKAEA